MKAPLHGFQRFRIRRLASTFTILATLSAGILIGSVVAHGVHGQSKSQVNSSDATPLKIPSPRDMSTNFTKIAKEVSPAVVNINTEVLPKQESSARNGGMTPGQGQGQENGGQGRGQGDQGDQNNLQDFFNHFFGMPGGGGGQAQQQQPQRFLGSGFIVDPRGYIITNDHVIDHADRIFVKLQTDPEGSNGHVGKVVGYDKATDLAVIKINVGHSLPTVQMGDSASTQVGDWVEAIGTPFDLAETVTAGIISAKNRSIPERQTESNYGGEFKHYLQTDAAINPGNSGGPLLNMDGQVIGVNTAIYSEGGMMGEEAGNMGIGFAMPSSTVISVYNQLIGPSHKVVRGSIGIRFQPTISPAVAKMYNATSGVLISSVVPGGPAAKAGLKSNDVIVSIDGKAIKNGDALISDITVRKPGSTVTVGYMRDGNKMSAQVGIEDLSKTANMGNGGSGEQNSGNGNSSSASESKLGLTVTNLPPNAPAGFHGVLIQSVKPGSFADELNQLGPGEVIESVNRKPIHNKQEFDTMISTLKSGEDVVFEVAFPRSGSHATTLVGGTLP